MSRCCLKRQRISPARRQRLAKLLSIALGPNPEKATRSCSGGSRCFRCSRGSVPSPTRPNQTGRYRSTPCHTHTATTSTLVRRSCRSATQARGAVPLACRHANREQAHDRLGKAPARDARWSDLRAMPRIWQGRGAAVPMAYLDCASPDKSSEVGSPGRTRTSDPAVNSRLLYQLSYRGSPARLQAMLRAMPPAGSIADCRLSKQGRVARQQGSGHWRPGARIEPPVGDLQSPALPLCYPANATIHVMRATPPHRASARKRDPGASSAPAPGQRRGGHSRRMADCRMASSPL